MPVRLDRYLTDHFPDISRTQLQKLIQAGHIRVNHRQVKPSYEVQPADDVEVLIPEPEPTDIEPEAIPLEIVFEDDDLLVVNKPVGMVVHPAAGHRGGTLVNALLHHCGDSLSGIGGEAKPGIVHRLDKETSGLLIVAKNDKAHAHLSAQLKSRTLSRIYHALVWGRLKAEQGTIDAPIGRHVTDRKKMMVNPRGRQREALTHYRLLEHFSIADYVEVKLETGRTHQIRVHFQHLHHPVVGDPTYGGREPAVSGLWYDKRPLANRLLKHLDRQALHARELTFVHPASDETITFRSDLPPDMQAALAFCRAELVDPV